MCGLSSIRPDKKILVLFFFILPVIQNLFAQIDKIEERGDIIEIRIEQIAEANEEDEIDYTTLTDLLTEYYEHSLDLNKANHEELESLRLLNDYQIDQLITHRISNGDLISIYELQTIDGFDLQTIYLILPFVKAGGELEKPSLRPKKIFETGQHEWFLRYVRILEDQPGYQSQENTSAKAYFGSPDKLYTRYRFKYRNNLSWGFTAEKDAGEEFFKGSQKNGFDFYSAHFHLKNYGKLKQLALGDFQVQWGQGLTMWSGLAFGKSSETASIKKNGRGLVPYTSVDENKFMRGVGATLQFGDIELSAFGSRKKVDANIVTDTLITEDQLFSSLQATGLHRTQNELEDKNVLEETVAGARVAYLKDRYHIAINSAYFNYAGNRESNFQPYNQFEFSQNHNVSIGVDYHWIWRNIHGFGEITRGENGSLGLVNGVLISLHRSLSLAVFQRKYNRDYPFLFTNALAENSKNANESGLYWGIVSKPNSGLTLSASFDQYKFPWLKFLVDAPSEGYEALIRVNWKPSKLLEAYVQMRNRERPKNSISENVIDQVSETSQMNYRFHVSYRISDQVRLKNRLEWIKYSREGAGEENGFIIYQDVSIEPKSKPWKLNFRYALFDTDSYDSRIYAYESEVLYFFSIPPYYNRGTRFYINLKYRLLRNVDMWLRYSVWNYENRETIGSGLNEINGSRKSEIKAQIRVRF